MARTIQIEVSALVPEATSDDPCIGRLQALLRGQTGVHDVTVEEQPGQSAARLNISYDPDRLSVARIKELHPGCTGHNVIVAWVKTGGGMPPRHPG